MGGKLADGPSGLGLAHGEEPHAAGRTPVVLFCIADPFPDRSKPMLEFARQLVGRQWSVILTSLKRSWFLRNGGWKIPEKRVNF